MSASCKYGLKEPVKPEGCVAIHKACSEIYSSQPNPLQVTALVKYWLGGPDPLDYISMYYNPGTGTGKSSSPPHWHYVSCGLSDLHGDGRVHVRSAGPNCPSGFGFELTFRLWTEPFSSSSSSSPPPTWPAELLQCVARYVFSSCNVLCVGDHISWHAPLDPRQDSCIQHILLATDPQLAEVQSYLGTVQFIQIVGATHEELNAAQAWNGMGLLKMMQTISECGGDLLVTDMRRGESLFDVMPRARQVVEEGVRSEGSMLSGVSTVCAWEDETGRPGSAMSPASAMELLPITPLTRAHLKFNMEAIQLWPLAIKGRLAHGSHFTFKSVSGDSAVTLVSVGVDGALASEMSPLMAHGSWLQVYLTQDVCEKLLLDLDQLLTTKCGSQLSGGAMGEGDKTLGLSLRLHLEVPDVQLKITVLPSLTQQTSCTSTLH